MAETTTAVASGSASLKTQVSKAAHWPPLVYFGLGTILFGFWLFGTSVQVLTSEAWIMNADFNKLDFSAFGQVWLALHGQLPASMLVPFSFAWGVQLALIIASVGIELPKHPEWRYYGAWIVIILLIGVNSCGDYASSAPYGGWGQLGFTAVILFLTFCMGLFAIMAFKHGWHVMKSQH